MTSVLIVEDDEPFRAAVARDLAHRGFDVAAVSSVAGALSRLRERCFDVLLTDLRMNDRDGIDLLEELGEVAPSTRPILMSAFATARDHQRAVELGAVQVLCKPFTATELTQAIQQAIECETGFRGSLHGLSLIDVLQMFHFGRRTVSVRVGGKCSGEIQMKDGEITHASHGELVGEEALRRILSLPSGAISSGPLLRAEQTIARGFQGLVLDVLREIDEETGDGFLDLGDALAPAAAALSASIRPGADFTELCSTLLQRVDGALACGVVDLEAGLVLASHEEESLGKTELLGSIGPLSSASIARIEQLTRLGADDSGGGRTREARVLSGNTWRLMMTTADGRQAVVLVTRRQTNPGLSFWHLRASVAALQEK